MEKSRYSSGGFEERFIVSRVDGKPCRSDARYIVLDYSGADPHAVTVLRKYAELVRQENPQFADDLVVALNDPTNGPVQHN
jgi:hypothetical protein